MREKIRKMLTESTYVNPRDLFNMANLFKTYGFLSLHTRGGGYPRLTTQDNTSNGYDYVFDGDNGYTIRNFHLFLDDEPIILYITINSRRKNPLIAEFQDEEYYVLDDSGGLTEEFKELIS